MSHRRPLNNPPPPPPARSEGLQPDESSTNLLFNPSNSPATEFSEPRDDKFEEIAEALSKGLSSQTGKASMTAQQSDPGSSQVTLPNDPTVLPGDQSDPGSSQVALQNDPTVKVPAYRVDSPSSEESFYPTIYPYIDQIYRPSSSQFVDQIPEINPIHNLPSSQTNDQITQTEPSNCTSKRSSLRFI